MNRFWRNFLFATPLLLAGSERLPACSICPSISPTICDEIGSTQIAVFASYEATPIISDTNRDPDAYKSTFKVRRVLKGGDELGDERVARVLFFPGKQAKRGDIYLVYGNQVQNDEDTGTMVKWTTAIAVSPRSIKYIDTMLGFSKEGTERLLFARDYLTDEDEMLRRDAFDEFAKVPYTTLMKLKSDLDPDELVAKIADDKTRPQMRRLYFTLLSVCGRPQDLPAMEALIRNYKAEQNTSLDAMIACYLSLAGAAGLPLVEETYLSNEDIDAAIASGAAITALRFHGQESSVIDRKPINEVMRHLLAKPQLAGRILPDLARWEDWSVVDDVARLFRDAAGDSLWVRDPAVRYLLVCPLPEAKQYLEEFRKIDAATVKRAQRFMILENSSSSDGQKSATKTSATASPKALAKSVAATKQVEGASEVGATPADRSESAAKRDLGESGASRWLPWLAVAAGAVFVVLLLLGAGRRRTQDH